MASRPLPKLPTLKIKEAYAHRPQFSRNSNNELTNKYNNFKSHHLCLSQDYNLSSIRGSSNRTGLSNSSSKNKTKSILKKNSDNKVRDDTKTVKFGEINVYIHPIKTTNENIQNNTNNNINNDNNKKKLNCRCESLCTIF